MGLPVVGEGSLLMFLRKNVETRGSLLNALSLHCLCVAVQLSHPVIHGMCIDHVPTATAITSTIFSRILDANIAVYRNCQVASLYPCSQLHAVPCSAVRISTVAGIVTCDENRDRLYGRFLVKIFRLKALHHSLFYWQRSATAASSPSLQAYNET